MCSRNCLIVKYVVVLEKCEATNRGIQNPSVNRKRTDNTMAKKRTKGQTTQWPRKGQKDKQRSTKHYT